MDTWLLIALLALALGGVVLQLLLWRRRPQPPAVSPEDIAHRQAVLAQHLGVTRGSFYWHFKDREDLLRRVLQAWRETATENLTVRLESANEDPMEQLRGVLSLPFRGRAAARAARIELAIRAWARRDQMARFAVDEADSSRIGYIAQLFSALGFPVVEARSRAFLLYSYVVSESLMPTLSTPAQKDDRRRFAERLFTQKLDAAG